MSDVSANLDFKAPGIPDLSKSLTELVKNMKQTERSVFNLEHELEHFQGTLSNITKSGFKTTLIEYNKTLYDMSRQTLTTGQSYNTLKSQMDSLAKSTTFSQQEAAKFFQKVNDGTRGLKMAASDISDLAKVLQNEYGSALENVTDALGDLMEIQNKDVDIFERLKRGMDPKEVVSLASSYQDLGIITAKQADSMIRTANAMKGGNKELTEQEKKLRQAADAQQKLSQAWDNVKLNWAEKLNDLLPKIDSALSGIVGAMNLIPKGVLDKLFAITIAGGAVIGTKAIMSRAGGIVSSAFGVGMGSGQRDVPKGPLDRALSVVTGSKSPGNIVTVSIAGYEPHALAQLRGEEQKKESNKGPSGDEGSGGGAPSGKWWQNPKARARMAVGGAALMFGGSALSESMKETDFKTGEKTHTRVSAGVSAFSNIAGMGLTGLAAGGPWGAAAGAAIGLVTSFNELSLAVGGATADFKGMEKSSSDRLKKDYNVEADAGANWTLKLAENFGKPIVQYFQSREQNAKDNQFSEAVEKRNIRQNQIAQINDPLAKKVYGAEYNKLTPEQQRSISGEMKNVGSYEQLTGSSRADSDFDEKATKSELAKMAAANLGITDEKKNSAAAKKLLGKHGDPNSDLSREFLRLQQSPEARSQAFRTAQGNALNFISSDSEAKVSGNIENDTKSESVKKRAYDNSIAQLELIHTIYEKNIAANEAMYETSLRFNGTQEESIGYLDAMKDGYKAEIDALQKSVELRKEFVLETSKYKGTQDEIVKQLQEEGLDLDEAKNKALEIVAARTMQAVQQDKLNQLNIKALETDEKKLEINRSQIEVIDAKIGLAQSEMELSRALYMGLGPTIDKQMEVISLYDAKLAKLDQEIALGDQIMKQNAESHKEDKKFEADLLKKKQDRVQTSLKELEVTKNLREGYIEALAAFTNVSGSFSKIILKKEMGVGEMMRQFGGPGGQTVGGLGAGSKTSLAGFQQGGRLNMASSEEYNKVRNGYLDNDMTTSLAKINTAAAGKDAGIAEALQFGIGGGGTVPSASSGTNVEGTPVSNAILSDSSAVTKGLNESDLSKYLIGRGSAVSGGGALGATGGVVPAGKQQDLNGNHVDNIQKIDLSAAEAAQRDDVYKKSLAEYQRKARETGPLEGDDDYESGPVIGPRKGATDEMNRSQFGDYMKNKSKEADQALLSGAPASGVINKFSIARHQHGHGEAVRNNLSQGEDQMKAGWDSSLNSAQSSLSGIQAEKKKALEDSQSGNPYIANQAKSSLHMLDQRERVAQGQVGKISGFIAKNAENASTMDDESKDKLKNLDFLKAIKVSSEVTSLATKNLNDKSDKQMASSMAITSDMAVPSSPDASMGSIKSTDDLNKITSSWLGFADGGTVGGSGSGDIVPAMLTPGERVLTREEARQYEKISASLGKHHYAMGGYVLGGSGGSPSIGGGGGGGGGAPNISINVKGDTVDKIMKATMTQLTKAVNQMVTPHGTTARFFDKGRS